MKAFAEINPEYRRVYQDALQTENIMRERVKAPLLGEFQKAMQDAANNYEVAESVEAGIKQRFKMAGLDEADMEYVPGVSLAGTIKRLDTESKKVRNELSAIDLKWADKNAQNKYNADIKRLKQLDLDIKEAEDALKGGPATMKKLTANAYLNALLKGEMPSMKAYQEADERESKATQFRELAKQIEAGKSDYSETIDGSEVNGPAMVKILKNRAKAEETLAAAARAFGKKAEASAPKIIAGLVNKANAEPALATGKTMKTSSGTEVIIN
jgi:hypothetical protein